MGSHAAREYSLTYARTLRCLPPRPPPGSADPIPAGTGALSPRWRSARVLNSQLHIFQLPKEFSGPTSNFQLPTAKGALGRSACCWNSSTRVVQFLHTRGPIAIALSHQILKSGTSAGANYEEADDGSSDRDKLAKRKITLRELKETRFRLRVLRHTGLLLPAQDPVIEETTELVKIVATLVRKGQAKVDASSNMKAD